MYGHLKIWLIISIFFGRKTSVWYLVSVVSPSLVSVWFWFVIFLKVAYTEAWSILVSGVEN